MDKLLAAENKKRLFELRIALVGELYLKRYSYRKIAKMVYERLNLDYLPSTATIKRDVEKTLKEWQKDRIENNDHLILIELKTIDETIAILWDQWEKSCTDVELENVKKKGDVSLEGKISTKQIERLTRQVKKEGNVAYISEIRAQLQERRKLLGLYAPEVKKEILDLTEMTDEEKELALALARKVK